MRETTTKKILITDDAMFMRAMLKGILIENKYAVYEAKNGQEAIEVYTAVLPDLVFMDITSMLLRTNLVNQ
jgi:two-component system chemotaxis response regulator CheY